VSGAVTALGQLANWPTGELARALNARARQQFVKRSADETVRMGAARPSILANRQFASWPIGRAER